MVESWLACADAAVAEIVENELERQRTTLQLIASENYTSPAILAASGSVFTNKYSEGYPGKRYYGGNMVADEVEALAISRAKALFGADHANVQPHAGATANMAAYSAFLDIGDKVMGMSLDQGGHLTHGSPVNMSGKLYDFVPYGLNDETEAIDYDQVRDFAKRERPKMIVAGATAYPLLLDFAAFREIADDVGALLMVDAAHIMGLIAGGVHPSPVPYADVVTSTTHKTLRGPRGALILCREEHAKAVDKAVFPGAQGGPFEHVIAAKAVCFHEAAQPAFSTYAGKILENARTLATGMKNRGFRLVGGCTENHLVLADLRPFGVTGKAVQQACDKAGIALNKNAIPRDPESPFVTSGLRVGSAAQTTVGMGEAEMDHIADLLVRVVHAVDDEDVLESVRKEVQSLTASFPPYAPDRSLPQHV